MLFARAGVHREIGRATVPLHPCTGRSQVRGCTCRGAGINPGLQRDIGAPGAHTPSDAQGWCGAAPSPCVHCTGRSAFLGSLPATLPACVHRASCLGLSVQNRTPPKLLLGGGGLNLRSALAGEAAGRHLRDVHVHRWYPPAKLSWDGGSKLPGSCCCGVSPSLRGLWDLEPFPGIFPKREVSR